MKKALFFGTILAIFVMIYGHSQVIEHPTCEIEFEGDKEMGSQIGLTLQSFVYGNGYKIVRASTNPVARLALNADQITFTKFPADAPPLVHYSVSAMAVLSILGFRSYAGKSHLGGYMANTREQAAEMAVMNLIAVLKKKMFQNV